MRKMSATGLMLVCVVVGASCAAAQGAQEKIEAKAVGSDSFTGGDTSDLGPYLTVNAAGDRVGVQFRKCEEWAEEEATPQCTPGQLVYIFPQLRVDPQSKQVMLGDTPVAHLALGGGVRMSSDYRLDYAVVSKTEDTGFERRPSKHVEVFLEHR